MVMPMLALHNMSVDLASSLELRQVFDLVVRQAADTAGADQAVLLRVSRRGMLGGERRRGPDQERRRRALPG